MLNPIEMRISRYTVSFIFIVMLIILTRYRLFGRHIHDRQAAHFQMLQHRWLDHTALLSKILGDTWIRTGRCCSPHIISTMIHFRRIRERPRYGRDYVRSVYLPQSWLSHQYQVTRGQTTEGSCPTLRRNTTQIFWRIWATPVSWSSTTPLELWCRLARNVSTRQLLLFTIIRYYTIVPSYCDIVHWAPS